MEDDVHDERLQGQVYVYKKVEENFRKIGRTGRTAQVRVAEQGAKVLWHRKVKRQVEAETRIFLRLQDRRVDRIECSTGVIYVKHGRNDVVCQTMNVLPQGWTGLKREVEWFQLRSDEQELFRVIEEVIDEVNREFADEPWLLRVFEEYYVLGNIFQFAGCCRGFDSEDNDEIFHLSSFIEFLKDGTSPLFAFSDDVRNLMGQYSTILESWRQLSSSSSDLHDLDKGQGLRVVSFPGHSCALVFEDGVRVFVVPSRATSTCDVRNEGFDYARPRSRGVPNQERLPSKIRKTRVVVPKCAFNLKQDWLSKAMKTFLSQLMTGESLSPLEEREIRTDIFVSEFLMAHMASSPHEVTDAELVSVNMQEVSYRHCPAWAGRGVPWRRSKHYLQLKTVCRFLAWKVAGSDGTRRYKHVKLAYCVWLLRRYRKECGSEGIGVESHSFFLQMVQVISRKTSRLDDLDLARRCMDECDSMLELLKKDSEREEEKEKNQWTLTPFPVIEESHFAIPKDVVPNGSKLNSLREVVSELELGAFCSPPSDGLFALLDWAKSLSTIVTHASAFELYTLEERFFDICLDQPAGHDLDLVVRTISELAALHFKLAGIGLQQKTSIDVEKRSRAFLFELLAALYSFLVARQIHSELKKYWIPLDHTDLEQLLLRSEKEHLVRSFLMTEFQKEVRLPRLFRDADVMVRFASSFGQAHFKEEHEAIQRHMEENEKLYAKRLLEQQERAKRAEVAFAEAEGNCRNRNYDHISCNHRRNCSRLLDLARHPPDPILQPLPRDRSLSFAVVFFMMMPSAMRHCSRTVTLARMSAIAPPGSSFASLRKDVQCVWVNDFSASSNVAPSVSVADTEICLVSMKKGLWHSHYKSGLTVHYPDLGLDLATKFGTEFISLDDIWGMGKTEFTKSLSCTTLQWTMTVPNDLLAAENDAICKQYQMERWMTKSTYLTFSRLRAFPHTQVRNLMDAIKSCELPLCEPDVRTLLQQLLRHTGPFSDSAPRGRFWLTDMKDDTFRNEMFGILSECVGLLEEKVREHENLLCLIDCGEWLALLDESESGDHLLRRVARVAVKWFERTEEQMTEASKTPSVLDLIKSRRAAFASYSVLALCGIPSERLGGEDIYLLLRFRVHFAMNCLIADAKVLRGAKMVLSELDFGIASRARTIVAKCSSLLLDRVVTEFVGSSWGNAEWSTYMESFGAFSKANENGSVLSINVFTGTILINGLPIGMLPEAFRSNALFKRTFNDFQFCCRSDESERFLETTAIVDGCSYSFALKGTVMFVKETSVDGTELLLVDPAVLSFLPPYLVSAFSHWYDAKNGRIIFRECYFRGIQSGASFEKHVHYVLNIEHCQTKGLLLEVPRHFLGEGRYQDCLGDDDLNVVIPSLTLQSLGPVLKVLSKMELEDGILMLAKKKSLTSISVVSFVHLNLLFSVDAEKGQVWSMNYRNYKLASFQYLSCLGPFRRYLVLEATEGASRDCTLVLARDGSYERDGRIPSPSRSRIVSWEIDRFGRLGSPSVAGRLSLAHCFASFTSEMLGLSPVEKAMDLVRSCWRDSTFALEELKTLSAISLLAAMSLCRGRFALQLLIRFIVLRSTRESFFNLLWDPKVLESLPGALCKVAPVLVEDYLREKRLCNERMTLCWEEEVALFGEPQLTSVEEKKGESEQYYGLVLGCKADLAAVVKNFGEADEFPYRKTAISLSSDAGEGIWDERDAESRFFRWCSAAPSKKMEASWVMMRSLVVSRDGTPDPTKPSVSFPLCFTVHCVALFPERFQTCRFGDVLRGNDLGICTDAKMRISKSEIFAFVAALFPVNEIVADHENWGRVMQERRAALEERQSGVYDAFAAVDSTDGRPLNRADSRFDFGGLGRTVFFSDAALCLSNSVAACARAREASLANGLDEIMKSIWSGVHSLVGCEDSRSKIFRPSVTMSLRQKPSEIACVVVPTIDDGWLAELQETVCKASSQLEGQATRAVLEEQLEKLESERKKLLELEEFEKYKEVKASVESLRKEIGGMPPVPDHPPFLVADATGDSVMLQEIKGELLSSWLKFQMEKKPVLESTDSASKVVDLMTDILKQKQTEIDDIIHRVTDCQGTDFVASIGFYMQRRSNMRDCAPDIASLCRAFVSRNTEPLSRFLVDETSQQQLLYAIKLKFLVKILLGAANRMARCARDVFLVELQAVSGLLASFNDDPPEWLVLQMQMGVLIRPNQRAIARRLMGLENEAKLSDGELLQLNMGEGKSRVIVPMLCAFFARHGGESYLTLNVLHSQLAEVDEYLWRVLGDLLNKRIYHLPFNRSIPVHGEKILTSVLECKKVGGVLLVCPEHRLSLKLKLMEMSCSSGSEDDANRATLAEVFRVSTVHLLDESDEILRHTYQLVYTDGPQQPIDGGEARWATVFEVLDTMFSDQRITTLVHGSGFIAEAPRGAGAFYCELRVVEDSALVKLIPNILEAVLCSSLFRPSLKLQEHRDLVKQFVVSVGSDSSNVCNEMKKVFGNDSETYHLLLALRGLLSFDLLRLCLSKRHRVDYGVNPKLEKEIVVPFRAKDAPADRTEFGFVDVAIVLTTLHYYYEGLSVGQLKRTFQKLLSLSKTKMDKEFDKWYAASKVEMAEKDLTELYPLDKIDITAQMHLLSKYFGKNRYCINFFLAKIVFPTQLVQFPARLMTNSWDLAEICRGVVGVKGFSGTRDSHRTLPLSVRQRQLQQLVSIDGLMTDRLTRHDVKFSTLADITLLDWFLSNPSKPSALIDCGALLDVSNEDAARYVMKKTDGDLGAFDGAIFFNKTGRLQVLDRFGCLHDFSGSAITAEKCFVLFDDGHCRGTDLPLGERAHAVVTLGRGMNRDKLVQSCMRMRKLNKKQTVEFVGTKEIESKIRDRCHNNFITSVDVMNWVINNTATSQELALVEWSRQGVFFMKRQWLMQELIASGTISEADRVFLSEAEVVALEAVFGKRKSVVKAFFSITSHIDRVVSELPEKVLRADLVQQFEEIRQRGRTFLLNLKVNSKVLEEECEKEMEQEVEEEVQRVLPLPASPAMEAKFVLSSLWNDQALRPLSSCFFFTTLPKTAGLRFSKSLMCTTNFVNVISDAKRNTDEYLRPVAIVVTVSRGNTQRVVVVSGQEGDALLELLWTRPETLGDAKVQFFQFPHFEEKIAIGNDKTTIIPASTKVELKLFMGLAKFDVDDRMEVGRALGIMSTGRLSRSLCREAALIKYQELVSLGIISEGGVVLKVSENDGNGLQVVVDVERCFGDNPLVTIEKLMGMRQRQAEFEQSDVHNILTRRDGVHWG